MLAAGVAFDDIDHRIRPLALGIRRHGGPATRKPVAAVAVVAALVVGAACQYPRDVNGTLERVTGGTLRVGVIPGDPFVKLEGGRPGGVEPRLVEAFARELDAQVEYTEGGEEKLAEALRERDLDLVIGGLTRRSQAKKQAVPTRPYLRTELVLGAPPGARDKIPDRVLVEAGTASGGLLERATQAQAVPIDDVREARGRAAVVDDWLLDDLGLEEVADLRDDAHVMLAVPGENAFFVRLERFLRANERQARALLEREGRP